MSVLKIDGSSVASGNTIRLLLVNRPLSLSLALTASQAECTALQTRSSWYFRARRPRCTCTALQACTINEPISEQLLNCVERSHWSKALLVTFSRRPNCTALVYFFAWVSVLYQHASSMLCSIAVRSRRKLMWDKFRRKLDFSINQILTAWRGNIRCRRWTSYVG